MSRFSAIVIFGAVCLLIARGACADVTPPVPGPYWFFSQENNDGDVFENGIQPVDHDGVTTTGIVGFDGIDADTGLFENPEPVDLTLGDGFVWQNDMYVYCGGPFNVKGGGGNVAGGAVQGIVHVFNSSSVNLSEQGFIFAVSASDSSVLNMTGGVLGPKDGGRDTLGQNGGSTIAGNSTANISGGNVYGGIAAIAGSGSPTINISGSAIVDGVGASNKGASVNISGGEVTGGVAVNDFAIAQITDGSVGSVISGPNGYAQIGGGTVTGSVSADEGTVMVSGGQVEGSLSVVDPGGIALVDGGEIDGEATARASSQLIIGGGKIEDGVSITNNGFGSIAGGEIGNIVSVTSATLTINDGASVGIVSAEGGSLTVNGGTLGSVAASSETTVAIHGGTIQTVLQIGSGASVTLDGGTVNGGCFNSAYFIMTGGSIGGLTTSSSGSSTLSGGSVTGAVNAWNSSTTKLAGVNIGGGLITSGTSNTTISGGAIFGGVNLTDSSTVTWTGGTLFFGGISNVSVHDDARFIWEGGTITANSAIGTPAAGITAHPFTSGGGQIPIYVYDNGTFEVDGINLTASLMDPNNSNGMYSEYQVSGLFGDGTPIPAGVQLFVQNTTGGVTPPTLSLVGTAQKWQPASSGSWTSTANWSPAILPSAPGDFADFSGVTAPATITLDGDRTVGKLNINNSKNAVTIAQGSGGSLIMNNNGSDATINIAGNEQITAPVIGQDNTDVVAVANSSLVFAGGITMAGGKTLTVKSTGAPGTLSIPTGSTINGNLVSNASSINIAGGTVNGNLSVVGNGTITLTSGNVQGDLQLDSDSVTIVNGGSISLGLSAITVNESAKLILSGGTITSSAANNQAPIYLNDNSSLMMSGFGLNATLLDPNNDDGMYSQYQLTGDLSDGTSISSGLQLFVLNATGDADPPTFTITNISQKWATAGGGSWGSPGNWLPATAPNVSGAIANLAAASATITLDGDHIVGTLLMQGGHSFNIAQGSSGTLYLNNNGSDAAINVAGNHQILAPVVAQDNTDITIAANGSLSLADGIGSAAGKTVTLTSSSAGALTISGSATIGGDLVANGGSLDMEGGTVNGKLTAAGSSNVTLNNGNVQGGLLLQGNTLVTMNGGTVSGMTGHGSSELDLEDGEIDGDVNAYDNSNVFFDGGAIVGNINVYNSAFVDVSADYPASSTGPDVKAVRPLTAPSNLNSIYVHDSATVELDGINLSAALLDAYNDNGMYSEYQLGGYYPDGTLIPSGVNFFIQNGSGATFQLLGSGQEWNAGASGSWGAAANWLPAIVADGPAQGAAFDSSSAPATITLDGDRTLGVINMLGGESFTIVPGSGGTLTLNDLGFDAFVEITGHQFISAPVMAQDSTNIFVDYDPSLGQSDNGSLTLSDGITVATGKTLTKYDLGTLSVAFIRGGTLSVQGGTVGLIPNSTSAGASRLEGLSIDTSNGAALDLANNDVLVNNSTLGEIVPLIQSGFANGKWNGPGIISSSATAIHGLGVLTGAQFLAMHPGQQFDGNTVAGTDVLIKYTLYGDSNLDGVVNAGDYQAIDNGFNMGLGDWADGDFNYDSVVNGDDYTLIDNAFNSQGSVNPGAEGVPAEMIASDTEQLAAVPEPASVGMIFVGAAALLRRRRFI